MTVQIITDFNGTTDERVITAMEALTAKHTVLEKTLEKTKKVEQDTAAALANAQKNYEKAGTQLDEYRAALTKAEKELGWKAKHDIVDMCRDAWNWQKNNPMGYEE